MSLMVRIPEPHRSGVRSMNCSCGHTPPRIGRTASQTPSRLRKMSLWSLSERPREIDAGHSSSHSRGTQCIGMAGTNGRHRSRTRPCSRRAPHGAGGMNSKTSRPPAAPPHGSAAIGPRALVPTLVLTANGQLGDRQPGGAASRNHRQGRSCHPQQRAEWSLTLPMLVGAVVAPVLGRLGTDRREETWSCGRSPSCWWAASWLPSPDGDLPPSWSVGACKDLALPSCP